MKKIALLLMMLPMLGVLTACSSDDEIEDDVIVDGDTPLSAVERSVLGTWLLEEAYEYDQPQEVEEQVVLEFKDNRTMTVYRGSEKINESGFWIKPVGHGENGYYFYTSQDEDYEFSTYCNLIDVSDGQLTIKTFGCFSYSKSVFRRAPWQWD